MYCHLACRMLETSLDTGQTRYHSIPCACSLHVVSKHSGLCTRVKVPHKGAKISERVAQVIYQEFG